MNSIEYSSTVWYGGVQYGMTWRGSACLLCMLESMAVTMLMWCGSEKCGLMYIMVYMMSIVHVLGFEVGVFPRV